MGGGGEMGIACPPRTARGSSETGSVHSAVHARLQLAGCHGE